MLFTKILKSVEEFYLSLPRAISIFGPVGFLVILAWLDYITARSIHLSLLYAAVCSFMAWVRGPRAIAVTATICAILEFTADRLVDSSVPLEVDVLNHTSRLLLWLLLGAITCNLRSRLDERDLAYKQIHEDMAAAQTVQNAFLSEALPTDPRIVLSVKFQTDRLLGGDFFLVRKSGDILKVLVADVSGKGAPAALVTGLLRGLFTEISGHHDSPATVFELLDRELTPSLPSNMFVTAFFFTLNMETGETVYASAGHDPPMLWTPSSGICELLPTGLPLGLIGGFGVEEKNFVFDQGDLMVLFTDGLVNSRLVNGDRLGDDAVIEIVKNNVHSSPTQINEALFSAANDRGTIDDDIVLLTIKRPISLGSV